MWDHHPFIVHLDEGLSVSSSCKERRTNLCTAPHLVLEAGIFAFWLLFFSGFILERIIIEGMSNAERSSSEDSQITI